MLLLCTVLVTLVLASLLGHFVHWFLHRPWSGPFYRSHMDHHLKQYPPSDLESDKYRSAKWYHTGPFLFTPAFIVIVGGVGLLMYCLHVTPWVTVTFGLTTLAYSLFNDYVHDTFHLKRYPLRRYAWYCNLQRLHFIHHHRMRSNFGIVTLAWDKLFGTFRNR